VDGEADPVGQLPGAVHPVHEGGLSDHPWESLTGRDSFRGRMATGDEEFLGRLATFQARADFLRCPRIPSSLRVVTAG